MAAPSRMPRYDVRNDGVGPYAVFYCEACDREFRSQPQIISTVTKDIGRQAMGGFLRRVPILGDVLADNVAGEDPRYVTSLSDEQLEKAWAQVQDRFRECPTCMRVVCISCWDEPSGFCVDDSPRSEEIAEARGEQAAAAIKGIAGALGITAAFGKMAEAAQQAQAGMMRCPKDGTQAPAGTKFCPQCGGPMVPVVSDPCPNCGKETYGAKFCPECGTRLERPTRCPSCGAEVKGGKFCPECGAKLG